MLAAYPQPSQIAHVSSPASDSTLGPTSGLNVDGQHDHMRDTVIPTFLHYNLPLLADEKPAEPIAPRAGWRRRRSAPSTAAGRSS